jgi:16S rRNA (guanine527-N7)-methyltransferase
MQITLLAHAFNLELTPAQLETLARFQALLIEWNAKFNLTGVTDPAEITVKHFADSLSVALAFQDAERARPLELIDVGSGAGFPGMPLAIVFPHWRVTLLEATGKKVSFLNHLVTELPLENCRAIHSRAEDLAHKPQHRSMYDVAVARAVARLPTLLEYLLPLVRVGGIAIAQKGREVNEEIESSATALNILGGKLREVIPLKLPNEDGRHLIVLKKDSQTPGEYPRRAGIPERKPL